MLQNILKTLGLDQNEQDIFIHLARLENAPASRIAAKTGLKRTTCYQLLENLVKRNLVKRSISHNIRYYSAVSPKELQRALQNSIKPLEEAQNLISKNLQEINKYYRPSQQETQVGFFEGYDEIKTVYEDILAQEDREIWSMVRKEETAGHPLKSFWQSYLKQRIEKGKKSYTFVPADQESQKYIADNKKEGRQTVSIEAAKIPIYGDLKVSGNLVAIISQHRGRIFGLEIRDAKIAAMFKGILKTLWKKR